MFSRRRQTRESDIPLRYYTATNPPQTDEGFWVYHRFIEGARPRHFTDPDTGKKYIHFFEKEDEDGIRAYVPALLTDNPYVNATYLDSLKRLDYVTRRQLQYGDWFVKPSGGIFEKDWFDRWYDPSDPPKFDDMAISADIAMTDKLTSDYSCYQAWGRKDANYYLIDSIRGKWQYPEMKAKFKMFCDRHPEIIRKLIEDKSAGISLLQDLKDDVPGLIPFQPGTKSKAERAKLVSPLFEAGNVFLPTHRSFTRDFINEFVSFDGFGRQHDDQVDSCSQCLLKLKKKPGRFFAGVI
jgi:predicted phage terminase large subunit-like protein